MSTYSVRLLFRFFFTHVIFVATIHSISVQSLRDTKGSGKEGAEHFLFVVRPRFNSIPNHGDQRDVAFGPREAFGAVALPNGANRPRASRVRPVFLQCFRVVRCCALVLYGIMAFHSFA